MSQIPATKTSANLSNGIFKYGRMSRVRPNVELTEKPKQIKILNSEWITMARISKTTHCTIEWSSMNVSPYFVNHSASMTLKIINHRSGKSISTQPVLLEERHDDVITGSFTFDKSAFAELGSGVLKIDAMICIDATGLNYCAEGFGTEYMFTSSVNAFDFVWIVNGSSYYVLKQVLATCSGTFARIFSTTSPFSDRDDICIDKNDDVEQDQFKLLLKLIYGNTAAKIDKDNHRFLFKLAEKFEIPMIMKRCVEYRMKRKYGNYTEEDSSNLMTTIESAIRFEDGLYLKTSLNYLRSMNKVNRSLFFLANSERIDDLSEDWRYAVKQALRSPLDRTTASPSLKIVGNYPFLKLITPTTLLFSAVPEVEICTLSVKGYTFMYPKQHLALNSGYFDNIIYDPNNNDRDEIEVNDVDHRTFRDLLLAIYPNSSFVIGCKTVSSLARLAGRFQMTSLLERCGACMTNFDNCSESDCMERLKVADEFNITHLLTACFKYIAKLNVRDRQRFEMKYAEQYEKLTHITQDNLRAACVQPDNTKLGKVSSCTAILDTSISLK